MPTKVIPPPMMIEREYSRMINRLLKVQTDDIRAELSARLPQLIALATPVRSDIGPDWSAILFALFEAVANKMLDRLTRLPPELSRIRARTEDAHKRAWLRIVRSHYGVNIFKSEPWLQPLATAWERENIRLITKIGDDARSRLQGIFTEALQQGAATREISAALRNQLGIDRSRSDFIARDQIAKLNGSITEQRQVDLGVSKYIWRTSQDERVRDSHRYNSGKTFEWSKPPSRTGHPGRDFRCRCTAEAIFPEIDAILA